MDFPWISVEFPLGFPWVSLGFPRHVSMFSLCLHVFVLFSLEVPLSCLAFSCVPLGFPLGLSWVCVQHVFVSLGSPLGFPWILPWTCVGVFRFRLGFHHVLLGFAWVFLGFVWHAFIARFWVSSSSSFPFGFPSVCRCMTNPTYDTPIQPPCLDA